MYLGLDAHSSLVYEGDTSVPDRPVVPTPFVSQATLIETQEDWDALPPPTGQESKGLYFREDSFDPVTRTRRGRLYQAMTGSGYPNHSARVLPHPHGETGLGTDGRIAKPLHVYAACSEILAKPRRGVGATMVLGNTKASSIWKVVAVELTVAADVMAQLRSLSAFEVLPDLDIEAIAPRHRERVSQAFEAVLDAAFRESPTSVVDRCKDALVAIISSWLAQEAEDEGAMEDDIAKLADRVEAKPHRKLCVANLAKTLGRLHARGKSNEQAAKGARPPSPSDAELAIQAVGLALRDLGWARMSAYSS